jgi:hypothetical protein
MVALAPATKPDCPYAVSAGIDNLIGFYSRPSMIGPPTKWGKHDTDQ